MTSLLCLGGTILGTPAGPRTVETLAVGAQINAAGGGALAVRWIGRTHLSQAELAAQPRLWPVLVAAGALGDGLPGRDLAVLPDQLLPVEGHASVAAKWLVNGASIRRPAPQAPVDVFSLELDPPGLPAGDGFAPLSDAAAVPGDDAALLALRRYLANRAGLTPGPLRGSLDVARHDRIGGWAADPASPDAPVVIEMLVDGVPAPPFSAAVFRADLKAAGVGDGNRGFRVVFAAPLDVARCHMLRVRRAVDGADLHGSPAVLDRVEGIADLLARTAGTEALRDAAASAAALLAGRVPQPD